MKIVYLMAGHVSVVLGFVGIVLPILPTTPFLLLATYCYSKSSDRLHSWLVDHPKYGVSIRDWQNHGTIRPGAKLTASTLVIISCGYTAFFTSQPPGVRVAIGLMGITLVLFFITRPSSPVAEIRK